MEIEGKLAADVSEDTRVKRQRQLCVVVVVPIVVIVILLAIFFPGFVPGPEPGPTPGNCAPDPADGRVECPGSGGDARCLPTECCPGFGATGDMTFPCPTADLSSPPQCEDVTEDTLLNALMSALSRAEKQKFVRGDGWQGSWEPHRGYYIGNVGVDPGIQRFGIPSQNQQDSGNGFRNNYVTVETSHAIDVEQVTSWPAALAIGAIFSDTDMGRFAKALGKEFHAKGANMILGPAVNVHRVPRCGRNLEYFSGESPYLGSRLVKPYIRGVHSQKVLTSVKHFINNNQETCRNDMDAHVDPRTRWEIYYPPFEAAVQADVAAQMCGYNSVDGVPNCGSTDIMVRDLKEIMGFTGWVQSDWWALKSFDYVDAVDQEMPGHGSPKESWGQYFQWFTDDNLASLTSEKVDRMVKPQLQKMLRYGLLHPNPDGCIPPDCEELHYQKVVTNAESQALSRELATKSVIMLKNNANALPLPKDTGKIALLGSACNAPADIQHQLNGWTHSSYYNIGGSGRVITKSPVTINDALQEACKEDNFNCTVMSYLADDHEGALPIAELADVIVMCAGATSAEEKDRKTLKVDQHDFLVELNRQLSADDSAHKDKPIIVLTMVPGTIVMPWAQDDASKPQALLTVFLAGKYTGNAFVDTMFGVNNPSAKSPIHWPTDEESTTPPCYNGSEADLPHNAQCSSRLHICPYTERLNVNWHGKSTDDIKFPFGHGLSYTTFAYSEFTIDSDSAAASKCTNTSVLDADKGDIIVCVTATVTNDGGVDGTEVAQLYMGFPSAAGEPPKLLKGFHRLSIEADTATVAEFPLYRRDLQIYSTDTNGWVQPSGQFQVHVGASAEDIRWTGQFTIDDNGLLERQRGTLSV